MNEFDSPDEAEFRQKVGKVLRMFDRGIYGDADAISGIAVAARETASLNIFIAPDDARAARLLELCNRVVDEEVGDRPFGDEARRATSLNLWLDLVERPHSWHAFRRRCNEAVRLLAQDRTAGIHILVTIARSLGKERNNVPLEILVKEMPNGQM